MNLVNTKDHWAFLDEIEAPMWLDFTLDAKSNSQQIDDAWFHTSHPFHQCSARELKSMFSRSGEGSTTTDFDLQVLSSPKIPSSVSRSRGKHYRSKKWGGDNCHVSLNKPLPVNVLNGISKVVNFESCEELKPRLSFINVKGTSKSKTSLVFERKSNVNSMKNYKKPTFTHAVVESSLSSVAHKAGQSNTSTVTSESSQPQQQKDLEVSSRAFGKSSGLLSAVKITLSKSRVTRPASRVEINRRQSRDRKSSSSKSSVGSSSNPGLNAMGPTFTSIRNKERTPDSRNVTRMNEEGKNKVKVSNLYWALSSRTVGITNVGKSARSELVKPKVQYQNLHEIALQQHRGNEKDFVTGAAKALEKMRVGEPNRLACAGKENATGRTAVSHKCSGSGRDTSAGVMIRGQKALKQNVPQKVGVTGLVDSKGKMSCLSERRILTNGTQRRHFR
ncbi:hypothetical protein CFOL_v3_28792 [Cephalotus follicularis]|uniref:Uncharacterized protein n=1 Tax=Cephalotus follicularis TaxID=3775 RepID=A0A1Q3CYR5_CEPFO|nr:hypothetical protein CFOL_v3_28792 [Cephalotus follicularis]